LYLHAPLLQLMLDFKRSAECRNNHNVLRIDLFPRYELCSVRVHNKLHAALSEIVVHLLIVDHLAQEQHAFVRVFLQCPVADFNGIFDTIAEAEMARQGETDRSEVQTGWAEILFPGILKSPDLLDPSGDGGSVVCGDVKPFYGLWFWIAGTNLA
jgi:hypothetical protein